jgi:hypothetical protein
MSPDAITEGAKCAAVANAVLEARNYDPIECSRGVAAMAVVIAGNDPVARVSLARMMLQLVDELDPDLLGARRQ